VRRTRWGLAALTLLLGASAGAAWLVAGPDAEDRDSATARYATAVVERRDVGSTVLATGVIRPEVGAEVRVGSRVSGVLRELHVTVGDAVAEGQLLAVLDTAELQARRDQVAAALESARTELEFARLTWERGRQLLDGAAITLAEYEVMERAYRTADARARETGSGLAGAEIQLAYTRIRAPIAGVVAEVATQVGETVAASLASPTFLTIVDLDRLEVRAYVDETDIGRIRPGQGVSFVVDTYPDTTFAGTVSAILPKAEVIDNVVNYLTLVDIHAPAGRILRPEMTTRVTITVEGRTGVLAIPNGAIRRDQDGVFAYRLEAAGPTRTAIATGFRGRDHTEITAGLDEGDRVLVGPPPGGASPSTNGTDR
jgi:macrolide-specific efflux system membrane fusion protein